VNAKPYDPRVRPWYKAAVSAGKPIWTQAYVFASSGELGVTYAEPVFNANGELWGVLGVDLTLGALSQTLLNTSKALVDVADIVFATDLKDKVVGHPGIAGARAGEEIAALIDGFGQDEALERVLSTHLKTYGTVEIVETETVSYLASKSQLDPARAMPLQIFLARDLDAVLAFAVTGMYRNMALVFLGIVTFGVVATYAVKLRVEAAARAAAEKQLIIARDIAEAATQAKSTFLATMSHEIRTPMNGVMSMAELLGLTRLDAEQRRMTNIINASAAALLTIINDILDFSKIEAGKLEIEKVELSLTDIVGGVAELLATRAEEKGLELFVDIDTTLVDKRLGDPTRLRQILLNLGGNAVKFTERGNVTIRVREVPGEGGPRIRFDVRDTGIGLTEEQRGRLFQAFVQADSSTSRKYGGTGLGLSICQKLTELMDGDIGADSKPGEGSLFWFEVPMPPLDAEAPRYDADLSGLAVALVGLREPIATLAEGYLRATGITSLSRHDDLGSAHTAPADLFVVALSVRDLAETGLRDLGAMVALTGKRSEISATPATIRAQATMILSQPLTAPPLWRAAAVARGLEEPDGFDFEIREDLAFEPPPLEEARGNRALVLVAEDNPTNQAVIRQMLGRMGFACEIADNGRIALDLLDRSAHGVLLTDFNMPEMDGFELTRAIRASESNGEDRLPVIALTADALAGTEEACLEAGMDMYLTKPIDRRALGKALAKYVHTGLPLRRLAGTPEPGDADGPGAAEEPISWDIDIFDPGVLAGPDGRLDAEAEELIVGAAGSWGEKIVQITTALEAGDAKTARAAAHSLKGAALSVGANRLGRIASDIQDFLDGDDPTTAAMMADVLPPTLEEFQAIIPKIRR
jgi:signal transduction histidine kinase/CheY-like chemotaxis protein